MWVFGYSTGLFSCCLCPVLGFRFALLLVPTRLRYLVVSVPVFYDVSIPYIVKSDVVIIPPDIFFKELKKRDIIIKKKIK